MCPCLARYDSARESRCSPIHWYAASPLSTSWALSFLQQSTSELPAANTTLWNNSIWANRIILAIDSTVLPMSIYDTVYSDGGDEIYLLDQLGNEKEDSVDLINKIAIEQMLDSLSSKEKDIIIKRYFKDKTQIELAEELGVSQAQISRIEKGALLKIKNKVQK